MKNFINLILCMVLFSFAVTANSAPVRRLYQDVKLPTQQVMEKFTIENPAAAGTTEVLSGSDGPSSASATSVSTFVAQPDVPRNLVITPGGTTADVAACTITVTGTNYFGTAITEDFTFLDNASSATTGSKAFKTVSSVAWAASCEDSPFGATWSIGYGEKLGLNRCMTYAGHFVFSTVAGAYESTRATVAANATGVESNTADFNGTMNGSNDFEAFFIQNFRCFP
jgi:hypothetical protein